MESELSGPFDFVILGTGLTECVLSGALARAGKTVLHIDNNDFYGSECRDATGRDIKAFFMNPNTACDQIDAESKNIDNKLDTNAFFENETNTKRIETFSPFEVVDLNGNFSESKELEEQRLWNFELNPRLILAEGNTVTTLRKSGVCNYLEFKVLDGTYSGVLESESETYNLQRAPCSKSDVFNSSKFGLLEKRKLMNFLRFCYDAGVEREGVSTESLNEKNLLAGRKLARPQNMSKTTYNAEIEGQKPFVEFLERFRMKEELQNFVAYTIAMLEYEELRGESPICTEDAMKRIYKHLWALDRFGKTAFLVPMYGMCDIAQGFVRISAVNGGIFNLGSPVSKLFTDGDKCVGIESKIAGLTKCEHLILGHDYCPEGLVTDTDSTVGTLMALCTVDAPLCKDDSIDDDSGLSFAVIEPHKMSSDDHEISPVVRVIQKSNASYSSPAGKYVITLSASYKNEDQLNKAKKFLPTLIERLFKKPEIKESETSEATTIGEMGEMTLATEAEKSTIEEEKEKVESKDSRPTLEASAIFMRKQSPGVNEDDMPFKNVTKLNYNDSEVHMDTYFAKARELFEKLCPDSEFFPENDRTLHEDPNADSNWELPEDKSEEKVENTPSKDESEVNK